LARNKAPHASWHLWGLLAYLKPSWQAQRLANWAKWAKERTHMDTNRLHLMPNGPFPIWPRSQSEIHYLSSRLATRSSQLATRNWPPFASGQTGRAGPLVSWPFGEPVGQLAWRRAWREKERECVRETSSGRQTLLGAKLRAAILLARFIECGPLIQLFPLVFLFVCPFGSGQSQMSLFVRVVRHPSGRATPTGCAKAAQAASKQCAQTVPEQHTNWPKMDGESICDRPPTAQCSAKSPASSSPVGQSAGV